MSKNLIIVAVVALVLIVGGWFLMRPKQMAAPTTYTQAPTASDSAKMEATDAGAMTGVKEVTVEGSDFAFAPKSLSVKAGEKVKVVFKNVGKLPHNLVVDELNLKTKTIAAGAEDTVEFTASKSGTFAMYCGVGNHRARGMEGTVTVQ
jgi:plastocyanin